MPRNPPGRPAYRTPRPSYSPALVAAWCASQGLPEPRFEVPHIPGRRFRLDIAWPEARVGIEVQGGIWTRAAHSTGTGIRRDIEKRNLGLCLGWRVLECEPRDLLTPGMASMVRSAMTANTVTNTGSRVIFQQYVSTTANGNTAARGSVH